LGHLVGVVRKNLQVGNLLFGHMDTEMSDDEEVIMALSESKKTRWMKRIKEILFDDYQDFADGSYQGDIKQEILTMIQKNFPLNEPIAEDDFGEAIGNCVTQIVDYIMKHTSGVHEQFTTHFALDFVDQTLSSIFKVSETDPPPGLREDDFMYG